MSNYYNIKIIYKFYLVFYNNYFKLDFNHLF